MIETLRRAVIMPSDPWVYVCNESELSDSSPQVVRPRGVPVLLIKKEGQIYALSNKCAHMGCPLDGGSLRDHIMECPCHEWKYDIRSGVFIDAEEISLGRYQWRITDGQVFIKIEV
ncbi:MAG: Rieske (2Fe-2S) protein [Thermodesulfobacteriota bacterium]